MGIKIIAKNKRAYYDYQISDKFETGLVLAGTEVKSLRDGQVSLSEAFITIDKEEAWVHNMRIPHYKFGNLNNHEETRKRKLLLHRKEIEQLDLALRAKGFTLVPTMIYFSKSRVKLEIALGRGKKLHDKRAHEAKKEVQKKLRQGDYD